MRLIVTYLAMAWIAFAQGSDAPREANKGRNVREFLGLGPPPDAESAKAGEPLYRDNCSTCHGPTARGSQGPNLIRSPLVLHDDKGETIGQVIKLGRPSGGMPPFPNLSETQIYEIAEYIHLQVELAANRGTYNQTYNDLRSRTSGDPAAGRQFFKSNCAGCHSETGDLRTIGTRYPQAAVMVARFLWPTSTEPKVVTITPQDGESIKGTLIALDDFDVSLRDTNGVVHSWPISQVTVDLPDKLSGHRALLPKYTDADLHNLTAYLVTLK